MSTSTRQPAKATVSTTPSATKKSRSAKFIFYALLIFFALLYIYPFFIQIATSFKTNAESTSNALSLVPDPFTTSAWSQLSDTPFPRWFSNSVLVTVCVTLGRVFFCSLAGYSLARLKFAGRGTLFTGLLAVMAVPGIVLLLPKFLMLNYLGIYSTYPALIVPIMIDAAGIFIMKQFFETIPVSVEEAARIDGAGTFRIFWSVVLPMAKPALITLTILSFQGSWNELGHFIVATNNPDQFTLTRGVSGLLAGGLGSGNQYPISMVAALLMTIPTAMVFIFFQRYFTQGANAGAEKG
ncbi:MAG: carbohydrate ABC transporter permease [Ornithinimicrobium sp.]